MGINQANYQSIIEELGGKVQLVAVSKTKPIEDIMELYALGQRDFGENYVQELLDKCAVLPADIRWHFIGHLQSNKVRSIVPFVHLIHGVDSAKLLHEINKQAQKHSKTVGCLLQVHIATEETKFGLGEEELLSIIATINSGKGEFEYVDIRGLMGMASFTDHVEKVRGEFKYLSGLLTKCQQLKTQNPQLKTENSNFKILSMGMSADYKIAIEEGSTMVRIGSLLFGDRNYHT